MKRYLILVSMLGLMGMSTSACEEDDATPATEADAGSAPTSDSKEPSKNGGAAGSVGKPTTPTTPTTPPSGDNKDAGKPADDTDKAPSEPSKPSSDKPKDPPKDGPTAAEPKDIVDTAVAAGSFKQLAAALTKAGLVDALKADGPFTVFAPTDAAFDALEKAKPGTVAGLTTEQLTAVLKYHVVAGAAVKAADLKNGQLVKTLAGPVAAIDLSGDKPKINGVTISSTDIVAKNGVIHVIDQVLLPPGDIIEVATAAGKFGKLAEALTAAG